MRNIQTDEGKLERALKGMDTCLDWQLTCLFIYYENRAGKILSSSDAIVNHKYEPYRARYTSLVNRAKQTGLI